LAPIASIHKNGSVVNGQIISHVGHPDQEFPTMGAAVKGFTKQLNEYLDAIMGPEE